MLVAFLFLLINYCVAYDPPNCGKYQELDYLPIVGGRPITAVDMPWVVALKSRSRKDAFCTGSLISKRHVLTGAHCFMDMVACTMLPDYTAGNFFVCHGIDKYDADCDESNKAMSYNIIGESFLKRYQQGKCLSNDLVLLTLDRDVEDVVPICLPTEENGKVFYREEKAISLFSVGYSANLMAGVNDAAYPYKNNKLKLARMGLPQPCKYTGMHPVICASNTEQGAVCAGDSGGPLAEMHDDRLVLVGIHARSGGICNVDMDKPTVQLIATEVKPYLAEIQAEISKQPSLSNPGGSSNNMGLPYPGRQVPGNPNTQIQFPGGPNTQIQNPGMPNNQNQYPGGPNTQILFPSGPNGQIQYPGGPYQPVQSPNGPLQPYPKQGDTNNPTGQNPHEPVALPMPKGY